MTERHPDRSAHPRRVQCVAALAVFALGAATVVAVSGGSAGAVAASTAEIKAQSVGRFLDGVVGGMPIESLVDVKDARATAPGTTSDQNPFDVKLFNQADIPLTNAISIPTSPAVSAGLVNQVATANEDGSSLGASGAVAKNGGIKAGGSGDTPAVATVNLTQDALPSSGIPGLPGLPGAGDAASLGGITASIGAVSAQAQTAVGGQVTPAPKYNIAGLKLTLASPALGQVLSTIGNALDTGNLPALPDAGDIPGLGDLLNNLPVPITSLPDLTPVQTACSFQTQALSTISLEGGAITISPTTGAITIDVDKLLDLFDINVNELPANTDLLAYLLSYITNPKLLATGIENAVTGLIDPLKTNFEKCAKAVADIPGLTDAIPGLTGAAKTFFDAVDSGQGMVAGVVDMIINPLAAATAGSNPLSPLADALKNVLDIGVNVQSGPGIAPTQGNDALKYTTGLDKTANQDTDVQDGQTVVRAIEIDLLNVDTSAFGGLPGTGSSSSAAPTDTSTTGNPTGTGTPTDTGTPASTDTNTAGSANNFADRLDAAATAPNAMGVSLAFGNASVGPTSEATSTSPGASNPATNVPSTAIPIGVPAGQAGGDGSPVLPFVLLMLALTIASGGVVTYRKRGKFAR